MHNIEHGQLKKKKEKEGKKNNQSIEIGRKGKEWKIRRHERDCIWQKQKDKPKKKKKSIPEDTQNIQ